MWPPEAIQFLQDLEENNDTEWFRANRRRYDESLVAPARALTEQLSQLERFRAAIDEQRKSAAFERAVGTAEKAGLALTPPQLKRAPRGYSNDHPRLALLRLGSLTVSRRHALGRWLHTKRCDELVRSELEGATPLVRWLRETVGSSSLPPRDR